MNAEAALVMFQQTMTMSVLCGLGLALGIAFLRELTDNSVRSPRDITRVGQLNLLGMVSDINRPIIPLPP